MRRHIFNSGNLIVALLVAAFVMAGSTAQQSSAEDTVSIVGTVKFEGTPPERTKIVAAEGTDCAMHHKGGFFLDEDVMINENGDVQNAFVYIRKGADKEKYKGDDVVVLDQENCLYKPRVFGIRTGQTLSIKNSDPFTHNVRSFPSRNRAFNLGQPADTAPREKTFKRAERGVEISCDLHKSMIAYAFAMDHPFWMVTGPDGKFAIEGLPPGEYTVAAWHEKFKELKEEIEIKDGEAVIDFTFKK